MVLSSAIVCDHDRRTANVCRRVFPCDRRRWQKKFAICDLRSTRYVLYKCYARMMPYTNNNENNHTRLLSCYQQLRRSTKSQGHEPVVSDVWIFPRLFLVYCISSKFCHGKNDIGSVDFYFTNRKDWTKYAFTIDHKTMWLLSSHFNFKARFKRCISHVPNIMRHLIQESNLMVPNLTPSAVTKLSISNLKEALLKNGHVVQNQPSLRQTFKYKKVLNYVQPRATREDGGIFVLSWFHAGRDCAARSPLAFSHSYNIVIYKKTNQCARSDWSISYRLL